MALMATPWKHPSTGVYYLRRQMPEKLRPAFDGKALWKVSLGTMNSNEAKVLFLQANAALEQRFEEARTRLKQPAAPALPRATVPTKWSPSISRAPNSRLADWMVKNGCYGPGRNSIGGCGTQPRSDAVPLLHYVISNGGS